MRRRRNWYLPAVLFGLLIATGVIGVLLYFLATEEQPSRGGTYTEGIAGSATALNPLLAYFNDADKDLTSLLFAGLTRLDRDGTVLPDLAEAWEISQDGRTYLFHLRKDLKWHDGKPVAPEDVVFTFRLMQEKDLLTNPEVAAMWRRVKADKGGEDTVRFTLDQAFAPFLSYTTLGILPQHLLQEVKPKDLATSDFNASPTGTGPFRMKEATLNQVVLEANPSYHAGRPYIERMQFKFLQDDQALVAALSTKKVDGGLLRPSVGPEAVERVRQSRDLTLRTAPRASYSLLFLNNRMPLFQDKAVRQALAYSINYPKLMQEVAGSLGAPAYSPVAPESWAYNSAVRKYSYDPARASQLLDESGWKLNGAGVREKGGQLLKFSLLTNEDKTRIAVGEELVRGLRRVGVQAEIAASGATGLMQNFLIPRRYDALLYGIDPGYDPDPYPLWHSSQVSEDGLNVAAFRQPETDRLLEKARTSTDSEERRQLYQQFQAIFAEEVPSILLYHPLYTYAVDRRVKGISFGVLYETSSRFLNVKDWYIETQRASKLP